MEFPVVIFQCVPACDAPCACVHLRLLGSRWQSGTAAASRKGIYPAAPHRANLFVVRFGAWVSGAWAVKDSPPRSDASG